MRKQGRNEKKIYIQLLSAGGEEELWKKYKRRRQEMKSKSSEVRRKANER